jgi:methylphosphotriester-DNA--protein-cysteine methyltransferase
MRPVNRVFFKSEEDALQLGFRPCAHCMRASYRAWKNAQPSPRANGRI